MSNVIEIPALTDHTVAVFATHEQAEVAIKGLRDNGYDMRNLSILGQNYQTEEHPVGFVNTGDRMWSWGKLGAFWGTIWGMMFGSAMLVIPGIGPVMFAGWIVAAVQGALIGGGLAALGGALTTIGIPKDTVVQYETAVTAGSFLVIAHGNAGDVSRARDLLSVTPATRVDSYTSAP